MNDPEGARRPSGDGERRRIPMNAPTLTIVGVLAAIWVAQFVMEWRLGDQAPDVYSRFGVSGAAVQAGHWETLVTSIFVHAGLWHIFFNCTALMSLADPVVRAFGPGLGRWFWYFVFFLACGIAGSLAFVALHPNGTVVAVGASGAISGIWGATARLYAVPPGYIAPILSRPVWEQTKAMLISNLIIIGLFFALSAMAGGGGIVIAWEAHAGGYLFGLLAIGPVLKLVYRLRQ